MKVAVVLLAVLGVAFAAVYEIPLTRIESLRQKLMREDKWEQYYKFKLASKTSGSQTVKDYDDILYVARIQMGTPAQNFDVVFDTANADFWLPDKTCTESVCANKHKYDKDASSTYVANGQQCGASCIFGQDKLCLGESNLCYNQQVFGMRSSIPDSFAQMPFDGILGLGWPAIASQPGYVPPMQNFLPSLDLPLFTIWLAHVGPQGNVPNSGQYTYGAVDTIHCLATINYVPLTTETFWQFLITGVAVGSYSLSQNWQVISDTGTSLIGGPTAPIRAMANAVNGQYDPTKGLYIVPCSGSYPPIVFTIGGSQYTIPQNQWVEPLQQGSSQCYLTIFDFSGTGFGPAWILGDTFMRAYCTIYHIGGKKIGFAQSKM